LKPIINISHWKKIGNTG